LDRPINGERTEVVFEFNDMRAAYNEGITVMLKKLVNNSSLAFRLADFIANQVVVGTVVACEGENDVYAFGSIMPVYRRGDSDNESCSSAVAPTTDAVSVQSLMNVPCVSFILTHEIVKTLEVLIKRETPSALMAADAAAKAPVDVELSGLPLFLSCLKIGSGAVASVLAGVYVHARMANLPTELIGPLHRNVLQDYQWICQGSNDDSGAEVFENQQQKVDFMAVKYLVFISPCTEVSPSGPTSGKNKKQKNSVSDDASSAGASTSSKATAYVRNVTHQTANGIVYDYWEDEVFHEEGIASVLYRNTAIPSVSSKSLMVASLVPVEKFQKCVHSLMNYMP
jgi:hypothetical protein